MSKDPFEANKNDDAFDGNSSTGSELASKQQANMTQREADNAMQRVLYNESS